MIINDGDLVALTGEPVYCEAMRRLESRGYDSVGIAVVSAGKLRVSKCQGRVRALEQRLPKRLGGMVGIAHTRWATHGEPSDQNAHPHCDAENRIAVRFAYEWHDDSGHWYRSYGNENWEFDEHGFMRRRIASINDLPISEADRKYHWPLGRRPDNHPGLSDLGL